ncbi:hypothetical protein ACIQGW_10145 [Lysinibacillus xylanilyticus]|uniref:Uncharacterized protein n=1 Tax=Lysinibacillus xylanilyticus TaxID=582475 RepID=A0ABV3VTE5_9BACI
MIKQRLWQCQIKLS